MSVLAQKWKDEVGGRFECHKDMPICCFTMLCPCITVKMAGEGMVQIMAQGQAVDSTGSATSGNALCCMYLCCPCIFPCYATGLHTAVLLFLQENAKDFGDMAQLDFSVPPSLCCYYCFCQPCMLCQIARIVKFGKANLIQGGGATRGSPAVVEMTR